MPDTDIDMGGDGDRKIHQRRNGQRVPLLARAQQLENGLPRSGAKQDQEGGGQCQKQKREQPGRRFDAEGYRKVVPPPAGVGNFLEKIGGVADLIMPGDVQQPA